MIGITTIVKENRKMKTNKNDDFFNYFIRGLDSKAQAQLNLMYTHYRMIEEINHRREMEEMEQRITENVMKSISIRIEDEAIKQLRDMLNNLGN